MAAYAAQRPAAQGGGLALWLSGLVASPDGRQVVRVAAEGAPQEAERLGEHLAGAALAQGAAALLAVAGRSA